MFSVACYVAIEATVDKGTVCGREQEERKTKSGVSMEASASFSCWQMDGDSEVFVVFLLTYSNDSNESRGVVWGDGTDSFTIFAQTLIQTCIHTAQVH